MQQFLPSVDIGKWVTGLAPITPSSSTPDYVCMKGYQKFTAVICVDNATSVTGSAITLKQATAAAGTGEKALSFSYQWANADTGASDTNTKTAVTSDTFTTATTNDKNLLYILEVDATDLDMDNDFDWIRVGTGNAANTVVSVVYYLHGPRYADALSATAIA